MKKTMNKNGSKALAISILGGSLLSPVVVSADNVFGPIVTNKLTTLEADQGIREAVVADLDDAVKTHEDGYQIIFGEDEGGGIQEGAEFLVYPAYLTLKSGESVKLDTSKDPQIKEFVEKHSRVAKAGEEASKVKLEIDAIYHIKQIKRAPGSYLNPMLDTDSRRGDGFYGSDENSSLGFEFPVMKDGIISTDQFHKADPKNTEVDSGTEEPLIGSTDAEKIIGNILVAKYGDEEKDLGHITEDNSFENVDSEFKTDLLEGARFTIRQLKKPIETNRDFVTDITINSNEEYKGAESENLKNKATFDDVSADEYFAELNAGSDKLSITGNKEDFTGLPEGVYEINEVQAPKGFMRTDMKVKITVTVAENGIDRIVMVGDGTEDRIDGKDLYKVDANGAYNYGLKVNNYRKPGVDPEKPVDPEDKDKNTPLIKEIIVGDEDFTNKTAPINPGEKFSYKVRFSVPKDIAEYKYLEVYDKFDDLIKIEEMTIEVKSGETTLDESDFNLSKNNQKTKVVFTDSGIKKLKPEEIVSVEYKDVRFSEDETSEDIQKIMDEEPGYISNIAKLHFVNGSGDTVNPKDPDEKPTNPGGDNPHVTPNPSDPFNPGEPVKEPELPTNSEKPRVPEVPETNEVTATPIARDFEFKKIDRSDKPVEGAEFELEVVSTEGNISIEEDKLKVDGYDLVGRTVKATSDENGVVRFEGLPAGEYTIKETKAPEGFRLAKEKISLVIEATPGDTSKVKAKTTITAKYDGQSVSVEDKSLVLAGEDGLKVVNYKYNETPKTGTLGKLPYIGAGIAVLVIGAITLKKKED